jgi:carbon storage regulator
MLVLSRKLGESIVIDGRITVKIVRLDGDVVKLGIEAPAEVAVHRQEVYEEIQRNNQGAVAQRGATLPRLAPRPPKPEPAKPKPAVAASPSPRTPIQPE